MTFYQFHKYGGLAGFLLYFYGILLIFLRRRRELEAVATIDTSALIQIAYAAICFIVGITGFISSKNVRNIQLNTPLKFLLSFHLLGFISIAWSVSPSLTGYRAFECITYSLLILVTLNNVFQKKGVEILLKWVLFYAVFSIFTSVIARAKLAGMNIFSLQTLLNEQMNSTPYFFFALLLPSALIIKILILGISIFSLSNTAYAGMVLGSSSFISGNKSLKILFFVTLFFLGLIISTYGIIPFLQNTVFYGKQGVGLEYTTGRDIIFEYSWQQALKKPLTGYGFVAGDTFVINQRFDRGAIGAHNGLLSALLGMGYPGALLFSIFLIKMFFLSRDKVLPNLYRSVFMGSAILIIVQTMGNPGLGTRVYGTWMPAMVIFTTTCLVHWYYAQLEKNPSVPTKQINKIVKN
ncbi:O-antigen ligase family protein [Phaeodactylibacter xiamenensis]|uniref:O-antigen ligase family protein n=1 Tax=Phaeodactylibacter xiamenensis TaxID=1524460 RepID=UPI0024A9BE73|nr:O-antigen ligase family protein [Phaeodactylibacter xiamenensis]